MLALGGKSAVFDYQVAGNPKYRCRGTWISDE